MKPGMDIDLGALRSLLMTHPAITDARVSVNDGDAPLYSVAVQVDSLAAPIIAQSLKHAAEASASGLSAFEPDDKLLVFQKNTSETSFLYEEIWRSDAYFRSGLRLPPGAIVVDVGANIGLFTLLSGSCCPDAKIIAVEPIAELCVAICLNASIHDIDATVVNAVVGGEIGQTAFVYYPNNTVMSTKLAEPDRDMRSLENFLTTSQSAEDEGVLRRVVTNRLQVQERQLPVVTVTSIIDEFQLERIDLLKIDVEKAELEVLAGISDRAWAKIEQVVLEVHDIASRVEGVKSLLSRVGFNVAVEREPSLVNTDCFTMYASRSAFDHAQAMCSFERKTGRWPTRISIRKELLELVRKEYSAVDDRSVSFDFVESIDPIDESQRPRSTIDSPQSSYVRSALGPQIETELRTIWSTMFASKEIQLTSNFFDMGGNSLAAVRLVSHIERKFGKGVLPLEALFEDGVFSNLVDVIDQSLRSNGDSASSALSSVIPSVPHVVSHLR